MMTPELQALSERLEELEKQVAHLADLVVKESDTDRTISARSIVITDRRGARRAELGVVAARDGNEDLPWLGLFDAKGALAACMALGEEGPFLELYHAEHKAIDLSAGKDGPGILLLDADGKPRVHLAVLPSVGNSLEMIDGNGTMRLDLSVSPSGEPRFNLRDGNGRNRLTLDVPSGKSRSLGLIIRDPNGTAIVNVGEAGDSPFVCLFDPKNPDGNTSVQFAMENGVPSLVCVKEGKVLWSAP